MAELVKIDPKSIGVGLYQHDVNQKKLSETLDEVVSSVVNNVGVNLNTASASLLRYVSGINSSLAKKIVKYREAQGKIASRQELTSVLGMGPKSFEQCAGFLKIPESLEPLDNTWVHPENYEIARTIQNTVTATGNLHAETAYALKDKHGVGDTTIQDIIEELKKPNRDPREGYPKPIMQKDVLSFEDLHEGMMITGKIKNVVDFGAFVDLGIKETALVHISELSEHFVKDPMHAVKVGDVLDFRIISLDQGRRRISLSRKRQHVAATPVLGTSAGNKTGAAPKEQPVSGHTSAGKGRLLVVKKTAGSGGTMAEVQSSGFKGGHQKTAPQDPRNRYTHAKGAFPVTPDDDGTMYNPFAEAFKKMREKKATT
ncbi:putative Polyribonucleotide nucleotidyltransferase [Hollandina sp. SP2]